MNVNGINGFQYLVSCNSSQAAIYQPNRNPRIKRNTPPFILIYVRQRITNHFISRLGMAFNGNLVGHGATRAKYGCGHPKQGSTHFF